ncbi:hypothetical protein, partial [Janibacter indicus]|uniref:hypothetical protein n=1 Tax=Janibacter indicus TaxID=857417 RepID=UPI003EB86A98
MSKIDANTSSWLIVPSLFVGVGVVGRMIFFLWLRMNEHSDCAGCSCSVMVQPFVGLLIGLGACCF